MKRKAEKNRGKWREKRKEEASEKKKKKREREKSQLTLGQWVGPTNSWKKLSEDKWVMVPNRVGCFKWWVMEIEWGVMSDQKKKKIPNKAIAVSISKYNFIYFNTPLYNKPNIKGFICFNTSLKYYLLMIYNSFLFLPPTHRYHPSHHKPRINNLNRSGSTYDTTNYHSHPQHNPWHNQLNPLTLTTQATTNP